MTTLMATKTQEQDETDLAQQAIRDVDAFAELYRRHLTRVYLPELVPGAGMD